MAAFVTGVHLGAHRSLSNWKLNGGTCNVRSFHTYSQSTSRAAPVSTRANPTANLLLSTPRLLDTSLLLADDMYAKIAVGGLGIISSGIIGAFVVGTLARRNIDALEREIVERDSIGETKEVEMERGRRIQDRIDRERAERAAKSEARKNLNSQDERTSD